MLYDHAYSESWHSQNSLFKHFQGYLGIFRDIDAYSVTLTGMQQGEDGRPPLPILKIENSALILKRKALILSNFELYFLLTDYSSTLLIYTA